MIRTQKKDDQAGHESYIASGKEKKGLNYKGHLIPKSHDTICESIVYETVFYEYSVTAM